MTGRQGNIDAVGARAWENGVLGRGLQVFRSQGVTVTARRTMAWIQDFIILGCQRMRGRRTFVYDGVTHDCLAYLYNRTWTNEREVEIPLALAFLATHPGPALEVGNVMGHYGRTGHVVIDKYEEHPGVLNVDVVDYDPTERFAAIICISTLEHVGWDEEPRDPTKIVRAVGHLRQLLQPTGRMLITCPLSYNPNLDKLIAERRMQSERECFLVRGPGGWQQSDLAQAFAEARYDGRCGDAVWVAEFGADGTDD